MYIKRQKNMFKTTVDGSVEFDIVKNGKTTKKTVKAYSKFL